MSMRTTILFLGLKQHFHSNRIFSNHVRSVKKARISFSHSVIAFIPVLKHYFVKLLSNNRKIDA